MNLSIFDGRLYFKNRIQYSENVGDYNMDITITAAILVKDEERCIARCIDSVLPLFDEVVILDTGSTDGTMNIIKEYQSKKIKIFQTTWSDDFSQARNIAISKCTSQYIFFVDADEYISTSKENVRAEFIKMDSLSNGSDYVYSPEIISHDHNSTKTVRRGFANNGSFIYYGYVHEELRKKDGSNVKDIEIGIVIHHDGYRDDVIKAKDKYNRNRSLNLKNISREPDNLRWNFFYFRDCFEGINPLDIYQSIEEILKIRHDIELGVDNLKFEPYTFALLDLMARATLKTMNNEAGFYSTIQMMNRVIPNNSNAFYYELVYDILKWKRSTKKRIDEIIKFKNKKEQYHEGMIHSDGLHIDAALSYYLYEVGLITQANKLLLSVESGGFSSEMNRLYLKQINLMNNSEVGNGC